MCILGTIAKGKKMFFWKSRQVEVPMLVLSGVIGRYGRFQQGLSYLGIHRLIEQAFQNPKIPALALLINSPGGSPTQSALIAQAIRQRADEHKIPIFSFVEDVAASGGYWLACIGDEIYANPSSLIGSIGVISSGFGFTELIRKIGIERRVFTAGDRKMMLDPFAPLKNEDQEKVKSLQQSIHQIFKDYVVSRRGSRISAHNADIFNGDIWTGQQAVEKGLVDGIGGIEDVLQKKLGKKAKFIRIEAKKGFIQRYVGSSRHRLGVSEELLQSLEERWWWERLGI